MEDSGGNVAVKVSHRWVYFFKLRLNVGTMFKVVPEGSCVAAKTSFWPAPDCFYLCPGLCSCLDYLTQLGGTAQIL